MDLIAVTVAGDGTLTPGAPSSLTSEQATQKFVTDGGQTHNSDHYTAGSAELYSLLGLHADGTCEVWRASELVDWAGSGVHNITDESMHVLPLLLAWDEAWLVVAL